MPDNDEPRWLKLNPETYRGGGAMNRRPAERDPVHEAAKWLLTCHDDMIRGLPVRGLDEAWEGLRTAVSRNSKPNPLLLAATQDELDSWREEELNGVRVPTITDEMVERAFNALWKDEWNSMHPWALAGEGPREAMRAALDAALKVQNL